MSHRSRSATALLVVLFPVFGCGEVTDHAPYDAVLGTMSAPILGGSVAPPGQWNEVSGHNCTGVLIAPRWVLTAGHCGRFNDLVQLAHRTENHSVVGEYLYPDWENTLDLGLIELATASEVPPATVAHGCASRYIQNGAALTIVGYGATRSYPTPPERFNFQLRQAPLTITDDTCAEPAESCHRAGTEFQAGTTTEDTCPGDSGGPAYVWTPMGPLVAGITSRVADIDPALAQSCGVRPGIYVRPDAALEWLESVMGEPLPEPDCRVAPVPVRLGPVSWIGLSIALGLVGERLRAKRDRAS